MRERERVACDGERVDVRERKRVACDGERVDVRERREGSNLDHLFKAKSISAIE